MLTLCHPARQPDGVQKILPIGNLADWEKEMLQKAVSDLKGNIQKGRDFVEQAKL